MTTTLTHTGGGYDEARPRHRQAWLVVTRSVKIPLRLTDAGNPTSQVPKEPFAAFAAHS
jgi:hypothetical protein